jgi:DNA repair exonuclease SbcCD ATPase subunit
MDQNEIERLRALIAEYDYRRGLNLTDLATLQSELRSATQENEQLRAKLERTEGERGISWSSFMAEVHAYTTTLQWATAWKAAAKRERERRIQWQQEWKHVSNAWAKEPSAVVEWAREWMERAETAEVALAQAEIKIDDWRVAEHQVSDAYLRLRQKLDAFDTPTAPTLKQIAQVTEGKVDELLAEVERLRKENTMLKEQMETAELELATGWVCPICGRALAIWVSSCDHGNLAPKTWTATSDGESWEKAT